MKLPCAVHPLNHALVQELALCAAFTSTAGGVNCQEAAARRADLLSAARAVSRSAAPYAELVAHRRERAVPDVGDAARMLLRHRVGGGAGGGGRLAGPPGRLLALYGPHARLPPMPAALHDDVSYAEAAAHEALVAAALRPLGLRVSLCGAWRRGAPLARTVDLLVALTPQAAAEMAVGAEDGSRRLPRPRLHRDTLALAAASDRGPRLPPGVSVERVPQRVALAPVDVVTPEALGRFLRALQVLHSAAYVAAGAPAPSAATVARRTPHVLSARLDPLYPGRAPDFHTTDAATLARMRLHRVRLHWCPWDCFHVRRFFLTGPPAFTAAVTLHALGRGVEMTLNGLLRRGAGSTAEGEPLCDRYVLDSERQLFELCGLPYVDPINRGMFCQANKLIQ